MIFMPRRSRLLVLMAVLLMGQLLVACTPARVHMPSSEALKLRHQEIYQLSDLPPPQVRIQSGDTLRIVRDAQEPAEGDDVTLFLVRPDGFFSMPFIGLIMADGRTPESVAEEVTKKLGKIYRQPAASRAVVVIRSGFWPTKVRLRWIITAAIRTTYTANCRCQTG